MVQYQYRSSSIRVDRLTDQAAYDGLKRIVTEASLSVSRLVVHPVFMQSQMEMAWAASGGELQTIMDSSGSQINLFRVETASNIILTLRRNVGFDNQPWQAFDLLEISPQQNASLELVASVFAIARTVFPPIDRMAVLEHLTDDQQQYMQQRGASIHRLETMQDGFFTKLQDFTIQQANDAQTNQAKLEEVYRQRATELESQYAELRKKLDSDREAFDVMQRELDLRDSTAVRRGIREDIKKVLTARASTGFALSSEVNWQRTWVTLGYLALIVTVGAIAGTFLYLDLSSTEKTGPSPWLIGRQVVSFLALTVSMGFFIRWLNTSATRHADDEFHTRKYELDFERASFVVEWALEWSKEGNDVPQFLIERLSRGLFDSQSSDAGPATAADAVASALFGSAATAKLKIGDNELTIDRKGINKLKKESD